MKLYEGGGGDILAGQNIYPCFQINSFIKRNSGNDLFFELESNIKNTIK